MKRIVYGEQYSISVPSAMKVGGDLTEAIKGTDLRECPPEYDAHYVGGAVSALSLVELGGKQRH